MHHGHGVWCCMWKPRQGLQHEPVWSKCHCAADSKTCVQPCKTDSDCLSLIDIESLKSSKGLARKIQGLDVTCQRESPYDEVGTCACAHGADRCANCTAFTEYGGKIVKGHFRLDGLCAECPGESCLIIAMFFCGIFGACVAAYVLNQKNFNLAFISIGVDYFQVLALFRGARIPWPTILLSFLRFFSIFNLNIDVAAPECITAFDFTFTHKYYFTVLLPVFCFSVFIATASLCRILARMILPGRVARFDPNWMISLL